MKPMRHELVVVTATSDPHVRTAGDRKMTAGHRMQEWLDRAALDYRLVAVLNGNRHGPACFDGYGGPIVVRDHPHGYLGVVPAFARGIETALQLDPVPDVIACFHDDVEILEDDWDDMVMATFEARPNCGLTGFGGGEGLGASDIYRVPYAPMQLARTGFVSNMRDADAHGRRAVWEMRVACHDGFSQIGRRDYWQGVEAHPPAHGAQADGLKGPNLFERMERLGVIHHAYDAALGCYAKRLGWEVWLTPVDCHHLGGQTAVGDPNYTDWANKQVEGGDQTFWERAHRIIYDEFKDVLPIPTGG